MRRGVVSVIDFRSSAGFSEIKRLLEKAMEKGKVLPPDWKEGQRTFRSLIVHDDGLCRLDSLSAATVVKRMRDGNFLRAGKL